MEKYGTDLCHNHLNNKGVCSRVALLSFSRTSGATHTSKYPFTCVTRAEFRPRTSEVIPESVKRALPLGPTRALG